MKNKDYVNVARHIIKSQVANGIMKYVYVVCILVMCNEIVEIKLTWALGIIRNTSEISYWKNLIYDREYLTIN